MNWNQVSYQIELGKKFTRPGLKGVIYGLAPIVYCQSEDGTEKVHIPTKEDMKATDWEYAKEKTK